MKKLFKTLSGMLAIALASTMIAGTALAGQETVTVSDESTVVGEETVNESAETVAEISETAVQDDVTDVESVVDESADVSETVGEEEPEEIAEEVAAQNSTAYSGTCGKKCYWTFNAETGVLTISGSGAMYDYCGGTDAPWYSYISSIKTVSIQKGVTSIGDYAFENYRTLTSVTIPSSVASIGDHAFENCRGLTSVTIPSSVTSIGECAFSCCTSLKSLTIPSSVTTIEFGTFQCCISLTSVKIPVGVKTVGEAAFTYCVELASVKISSNVTSIGEYAFGECANLADIYYSGSSDDWNKINVAEDNDAIDNAIIHYNSSTKFSDVNDSSSYYYKAVYWAVFKDITRGYTSGSYAGKFGVGLNCNRQDFALFLYRLAGKPSVSSGVISTVKSEFSDISSLGDVFINAIAWAYNKGIIKGYSNGTFGTNDTIKRKDAIIMLYRYSGKPSVSSSSTGFTDVDGKYATSSDTFKAIAWAKTKSITGGLTQEQCQSEGLTYPAFGANSNCKREQMITFIYRLAMPKDVYNAYYKQLVREKDNLTATTMTTVDTTKKSTKWTIDENYYKVSLADVTGDGIPELFQTGIDSEMTDKMSRPTFDTQIYTWVNNKLKKVSSYSYLYSGTTTVISKYGIGTKSVVGGWTDLGAANATSVCYFKVKGSDNLFACTATYGYDNYYNIFEYSSKDFSVVRHVLGSNSPSGSSYYINGSSVSESKYNSAISNIAGKISSVISMNYRFYRSDTLGTKLASLNDSSMTYSAALNYLKKLKDN